jgi:hypothetical protein
MGGLIHGDPDDLLHLQAFITRLPLFFPLLAPLASVALEAQKSWCHRSASAGEEKGIPLKPARFSSKIDPKEYPVVSHRPSWKKSWCASREEDHK